MQLKPKDISVNKVRWLEEVTRESIIMPLVCVFFGRDGRGIELGRMEEKEKTLTSNDHFFSDRPFTLRYRHFLKVPT